MNIYSSKYTKYYPAIPIALLIVSILMLPHISYSTELQGGVDISLITNSKVDIPLLSSELATKLNIPPPSITGSGNGLDITLPNNESLVKANSYLQSIYQYYSNYTSLLVNQSTLQSVLAKNPNNSTAKAALINTSILINKTEAEIISSFKSEIESLKPFIGNVTFNATDVGQVPQIAQSQYSNASKVFEDKLLSAIKSYVNVSSYSFEQITPTLGKYFLSQVKSVLLASFILIVIIALIIFRTPVPAFTVVFGSINDIMIALLAMILLKIPLSLESLGGLLMLIGFSMDTGALTAVRIVKRREGSIEERANSALKTGITMTSSAIVTFTILFFISIFTYAPTYYDIAGVVLFGLLGDIATTWLGSAPILVEYKRRRK
ncbi:MAG: hypothetical protein QXL16_02495 [Candidatus Micrarchaeaceae archaeon]